ncbi:MAG: hypothetical protein WCC99_13570 [Candidatus Sulfotelmatobacter sp.]
MNVWEAIASAERILPGHAATEGEEDPRWQAMISIADFIQSDPDAIWPFIVRWGSSADEDLRAAVATVLLEHLLQHHFNRFFPLVEETVQSNALLAETYSLCSKFGESKEEANAERFERLRRACRKRKSQS